MQSTEPLTLGAALERERLEVRADRMAAVLAALRTRADLHRREAGAPPPQIGVAIAGFEAEIQSVRARLAKLR